MDRALRITELWSWLPAFRVVAETEHLPSAAKAMHVSPSALSRSVSLLEAAIGERLFTRVGRRLRLNARGEVVLEAVRDAMRRIDDGLDNEPRPTRLRVAGQSIWIEWLVVPAVAGVELEDVDVARPMIEAALMRGDIDLAIVEAMQPRPGLLVERLGTLERALFRGPRSRSALHASCTDGEDPWPADRPRQIGLRSSRLALVLDACARHGMQAILPVPIARARGL